MRQADLPARSSWILRLWERLSLVARVMFSAGLALLVAGSILLLVSTAKDADFAREQIEDRLGAELESLLPAIAEWAVIGDYANIEGYLRLRVRHPDILGVSWTDPKGKVLEARDKDMVRRAPGWFVRWSGVPSPKGSTTLYVGGRHYGVATIEMTGTPALNRLWTTFLGHLGILALALALDFIGILLILKTGLRPLGALGRGAQALEAGNMRTRIETRGSPEIRTVVAAFNRMASTLEATQDQLREEAERLSVTLSSIGDGVIATDADGFIEFMNPAAEAMTGWTSVEAHGRSVSDVFAVVRESTRKALDCPVARAILDGRIVGLSDDTLLLARDGRELPVADSAAPIRNAGGHIVGAVLVFRDQTVERQTLDRLAMAASVFENSLNGVVITDADRRILEINPAFTRITGYTRDEALGQTPQLLSSGRHDAAFYAAMWSEIASTGKWRGEIWNRHRDGEIYPEDLSIVAVNDERGRATRYIGNFTDISQIKAQEAQLRHLAHHDPLTGLPNRGLLADRMAVALAQAARSGKKLAVCYLDLDGFKPINDTWGHAVGDRLLEEIANRLRDIVRGGDTAARLGGDEFALLLGNLADATECETALARILQAVGEPVHIDDAELRVTASIGVTLYPDDKSEADALLRHADQALYAAKEGGRNRFHLYDAQHDHAIRSHRAFLANLEAALAKSEFRLYFQPKVNMHLGTVIGAEALIRWHHPVRGLLAPAEFLPLLDGSELEVRIGEWVIDTALAQMDEWRAAGLDIPVSINVAPPHLGKADFAARLEQLLAQHPGTPPGRLELEVLESVALRDIEHVAALIGSCKRIGVTFALDDFGTGYSSLTYLKHLPVDMIKIDQSFVHDMLRDPEERAIVEGVVGLAGAFDIEVIAEGVETPEQASSLIGLGCPLGQGYGIARPMPGSELPGWVAGWRPDPAWQRAAA